MTKKERTALIIDYFKAQQPEITTELEFASVFQLLCAVMLSAQCTDKRVNMITPTLFRAFPDAKSMAQEDIELEDAVGNILVQVHSVSYPNSKALHLVQMARKVISDFGGEIPQTMEELTSLPGVGRKTANVMLAVAFDVPAMPVDTHVFRVSHRLGLAPKTADTPQKVERCLVRLIPDEYLSRAHHWLLLHGRYICTSRKPHCEKCQFSNICPKCGM